VVGLSGDGLIHDFLDSFTLTRVWEQPTRGALLDLQTSELRWVWLVEVDDVCEVEVACLRSVACLDGSIVGADEDALEVFGNVTNLRCGG